MAYVVTAPCFGCKYTDCVVVCPAECFHEGEQMLYIDPEECLDCDACVPECPVEAIFPDSVVPEKWSQFIELNAEMAPKTPASSQKRRPPTDAMWLSGFMPSLTIAKNVAGFVRSRKKWRGPGSHEPSYERRVPAHLFPDTHLEC